jgi:hypothetical protein
MQKEIEFETCFREHFSKILKFLPKFSKNWEQPGPTGSLSISGTHPLL